jgi:DNA-binding transcriptional ArsR family regulator
VLREAELVTETRDGTRRYYRASTVGLEQLRLFIESLWDDVLAAYAADDPAPPRRAARKKTGKKNNIRRTS